MEFPEQSPFVLVSWVEVDQVEIDASSHEGNKEEPFLPWHELYYHQTVRSEGHLLCHISSRRVIAKQACKKELYQRTDVPPSIIQESPHHFAVRLGFLLAANCASAPWCNINQVSPSGPNGSLAGCIVAPCARPACVLMKGEYDWGMCARSFQPFPALTPRKWGKNNLQRLTSVCVFITHWPFAFPCMHSVAQVIDFAGFIRRNLYIRWDAEESCWLVGSCFSEIAFSHSYLRCNLDESLHWLPCY